jgi:hypothetical protein
MVNMTSKYTTAEFIEKAERIHHHKYDYSQSEYINSYSKIEIICPFHGNFWQISANHLRGLNCQKCNIDSKFLSQKEFIEMANKIHNNYFDYSNVKYIHSQLKVEIICPAHGTFFQVANRHLWGSKCHKCVSRSSKAENEWLDTYHILKENRQVKLCIPNHTYIVDGFDPYTNTCYEFLGNYWHGNPNKFDSKLLNKTIRKSFGELFIHTMKKIENIKQAGYNVIYIWENDFINQS